MTQIERIQRVDIEHVSLRQKDFNSADIATNISLQNILQLTNAIQLDTQERWDLVEAIQSGNFNVVVEYLNKGGKLTDQIEGKGGGSLSASLWSWCLLSFDTLTLKKLLDEISLEVAIPEGELLFSSSSCKKMRSIIRELEKRNYHFQKDYEAALFYNDESWTRYFLNSSHDIDVNASITDFELGKKVHPTVYLLNRYFQMFFQNKVFELQQSATTSNQPPFDQADLDELLTTLQLLWEHPEVDLTSCESELDMISNLVSILENPSEIDVIERHHSDYGESYISNRDLVVLKQTSSLLLVYVNHDIKLLEKLIEDGLDLRSYHPLFEYGIGHRSVFEILQRSFPEHLHFKLCELAIDYHQLSRSVESALLEKMGRDEDYFYLYLEKVGSLESMISGLVQQREFFSLFKLLRYEKIKKEQIPHVEFTNGKVFSLEDLAKSQNYSVQKLIEDRDAYIWAEIFYR